MPTQEQFDEPLFQEADLFKQAFKNEFQSLKYREALLRYISAIQYERSREESGFWDMSPEEISDLLTSFPNPATKEAAENWFLNQAEKSKEYAPVISQAVIDAIKPASPASKAFAFLPFLALLAIPFFLRKK